MKKFRKLSQLEKQRKFSKIKTTKIWVPKNIIRNPHAKFQVTSATGNTRKSRGTMSKSKNWKSGEN